MIHDGSGDACYNDLLSEDLSGCSQGLVKTVALLFLALRALSLSAQNLLKTELIVRNQVAWIGLWLVGRDRRGRRRLRSI